MVSRADKWFEPGIFRLRCIENNKAFFGEGAPICFSLEYLLEDLDNGTCPNQLLQADQTKFGASKFEIGCVAFGKEYYLKAKRLPVLEQFKKSSPPALY